MRCELEWNLADVEGRYRGWNSINRKWEKSETDSTDVGSVLVGQSQYVVIRVPRMQYLTQTHNEVSTIKLQR